MHHKYNKKNFNMSFIFNNHIVQYDASFHNVLKSFACQKCASPRTIPNRAYNTPNARSTSFLADS